MKKRGSWTAWLGALVFVAAVAGGTWWGMNRARDYARSDDSASPRSVLIVRPGPASRQHRHSFTLDAPSKLTIRLANPSAARGRVSFGPLDQIPASGPVDETRLQASFEGAATSEWTWLDFAVGTRVVHIELEQAAPLGIEVLTQPAR